eukprot:SM000019S05138  [mRNA]  locus=s19:1053662:1056135:- [translate_table: standard]
MPSPMQPRAQSRQRCCLAGRLDGLADGNVGQVQWQKELLELTRCTGCTGRCSFRQERSWLSSLWPRPRLALCEAAAAAEEDAELERFVFRPPDKEYSYTLKGVLSAFEFRSLLVAFLRNLVSNLLIMLEPYIQFEEDEDQNLEPRLRPPKPPPDWVLAGCQTLWGVHREVIVRTTTRLLERCAQLVLSKRLMWKLTKDISKSAVRKVRRKRFGRWDLLWQMTSTAFVGKLTAALLPKDSQASSHPSFCGVSSLELHCGQCWASSTHKCVAEERLTLHCAANVLVTAAGCLVQFIFDFYRFIKRREAERLQSSSQPSEATKRELWEALHKVPLYTFRSCFSLLTASFGAGLLTIIIGPEYCPILGFAVGDLIGPICANYVLDLLRFFTPEFGTSSSQDSAVEPAS